MGKKERHSI